MARILMIDDNNMGLVARKSVLDEMGHDVQICSVPQEALELFAQQKFDIVITDYKMPRLNGIQLIAKLREFEGYTNVILISGFADTLGLNEANTGADIVLQKSANEVAHLIRAVNRLLRKPAKKNPGRQGAPAKKKKSL